MLDITVAFLCSLLAGMGVGGGGLLIIYLTLIKNMPQDTAQGINLAFFVVSMALSLIIHIKTRSVYKSILPIALPFCIMGGILGSVLASHIHTQTLKLFFGFFLIICGIISLVKSKKHSQNTKK